jgi:N-methylhydantoinase A
MTSYRLGIDIGGTFTDFALLEEETGRIEVLKTPTNPERPEQSVFDGVARLYGDHNVRPDELKYFIHGTTLAVNTIIQRSGAKTALLITQGFRDILNIGRHRIPDVFNFFTEMPVPLVPRAHVFEIPERCTAAGSIIRSIDESAVRDAAMAIHAAGIDAIAVCFLHSYCNPANELRAREILEEIHSASYISLSSDIWAQMREYERALVAVMNAHIGRKMKTYFTNLQKGVRDLGIRAGVLSTKSNGGVMYAHEAGERPVETLLSGPAAGVIGASFIGRATGLEKLITFDMGGTSADIAIIDGEPRYSTENQVGDFPVIMPAIDVTSIGAGGGSIAWTDSNGVLKVGPMSAGADPGPACYGLGGENPTVTDAYVCLGVIDPHRFLGGTVDIQPALAEQAMARIGQVIGLDVREAAESILRVATSQMYAVLVPLLARKGISYEDFTLLCFGGAGPTHGFLLAHEIGIRRVLVPLHPGVLCAAGSLAADLRRDFVRTIHTALVDGTTDATVARLAEGFAVLTDEGQRWLDSHALGFVSTRVEWTADMRYLGQSFELTVAVTEDAVTDGSGQALRDLFHREYEKVYGYVDEAADLEVLDIRATAVGVTPKPKLEQVKSRQDFGKATVPAGEREIFIFGKTWKAAVLDRFSLPPDTKFEGPAIVEQYDTTVLVPPGFTVTVDRFGNLVGEARDGR